MMQDRHPSNISIWCCLAAFLLPSFNVAAEHHHHGHDRWRFVGHFTYQSKSNTTPKGFLMADDHAHSSGVYFDHAMLAYNRTLADSSDESRHAHVSIHYHDDHSGGMPFINNAWIKNTWHTSGFSITAGKLSPRIGFLNHRHQHNVFSDTAPWLKRVYWQHGLTDVGLEIKHEWLINRWYIRQNIGLLAGNHLRDTTAKAGVYQIEVGHKNDAFEIRWLANVYRANADKRGLSIFDNAQSHQHTEESPEFIRGNIWHWGLGFQVAYHSAIGRWSWQGEFAQRHEYGDLFSNNNNAVSALGALNVSNCALYQQLSWTHPNQVWSIGVAHDYVYSRVKLNDANDVRLDRSSLNNQGSTPERWSLLGGWQLNPQQTIHVGYAIERTITLQRSIAIHFKQSFSF